MHKRGTENPQRCYLLHHQITKDSLRFTIGPKLEKVRFKSQCRWWMISSILVSQFQKNLFHSVLRALFLQKNSKFGLLRQNMKPPKSQFFPDLRTLCLLTENFLEKPWNIVDNTLDEARTPAYPQAQLPVRPL